MRNPLTSNMLLWRWLFFGTPTSGPIHPEDRGFGMFVSLGMTLLVCCSLAWLTHVVAQVIT